MAENSTAPCLLCFGLGYSARFLARRLAGEGWAVRGTARSPESASRRQAAACTASSASMDCRRPLSTASRMSWSRSRRMRPATRCSTAHAADIAALPGLAWLGYLSTTGVYGDRGGGWVDEQSDLRPSGERGRRRVAAEAGWLDLWRRSGVPVHIFRLAAIYGPGRSPFTALRDGTAKRIAKPGQVFSRIHVEDLAERARRLDRAAASRRGLQCLRRRAGAARGGRRLCRGAARAVGRRRWCRSRRPGCRRWRAASTTTTSGCRTPASKSELGVALRYPTYREGLAAILREEARGLP